jgi:uncharacterized RDD family membrane protein YckC
MTDQYRNLWPDRPGSTQHGGVSSAAAEPGHPPLPGYPVPADWRSRARARLIDQAPTYVGLIIFLAGYLVWVIELAQSGGSIPDFEGAVVAMIIGLSVIIASLAWVAYNRWMVAGKTGQSLGKRLTKIRLIGEETKAPVGALNAFVRDLVHILDGLTIVGYLWPRWDDKKQTFGDKIMKTIVVNAEPPNSSTRLVAGRNVH